MKNLGTNLNLPGRPAVKEKKNNHHGNTTFPSVEDSSKNKKSNENYREQNLDNKFFNDYQENIENEIAEDNFYSFGCTDFPFPVKIKIL